MNIFNQINKYMIFFIKNQWYQESKVLDKISDVLDISERFLGLFSHH